MPILQPAKFCLDVWCVRGKIVEQKMADLPKERLQADLPLFSNVGVDYFGPFEIKRGRSQVKRYGVVFTCMTSRAIHLEMAHSLTTDSCIDALRQFIARRGQVMHIRSDNGTNLVGAKIIHFQNGTKAESRELVLASFGGVNPSPPDKLTPPADNDAK